MSIHSPGIPDDEVQLGSPITPTSDDTVDLPDAPPGEKTGVLDAAGQDAAMVQLAEAMEHALDDWESSITLNPKEEGAIFDRIEQLVASRASHPAFAQLVTRVRSIRVQRTLSALEDGYTDSDTDTDDAPLMALFAAHEQIRLLDSHPSAPGLQEYADRLLKVMQPRALRIAAQAHLQNEQMKFSLALRGVVQDTPAQRAALDAETLEMSFMHFIQRALQCVEAGAWDEAASAANRAEAIVPRMTTHTTIYRHAGREDKVIAFLRAQIRMGKSQEESAAE